MRQDLLVKALAVESWIVPDKGKVTFVTLSITAEGGPRLAMSAEGRMLAVREPDEKLRAFKDRLAAELGPGEYYLCDDLSSVPPRPGSA